MTDELSICLYEDKHFYPGDTIQGLINFGTKKKEKKKNLFNIAYFF
jgi:hypothetical protein